MKNALAQGDFCGTLDFAMQRNVLGWILAIAFLLTPVLRGNEQADTDQFIAAYALISSADETMNGLWKQTDNPNRSELLADALQRYQQALKTLQTLQNQSTAWFPDVVAFRIKYCQGKIAELKAKIVPCPPEPSSPPEIPAQAIATTTPPPAPFPAGSDQTSPNAKQQPESIQKLQAEFQAHTQRISDLTTELAKAQAEKKELATKLQDAEHARQQATSANAANLERIKQLEKSLVEVSSIKQELAKAQKEKTELEARLAQAEKGRTERNATTSDLRARITRYETQIQTLTKENQSSSANLAGLRKELESTKKNLVETEKQNRAQELRAEENRKQLEMVRKQLAASGAARTVKTSPESQLLRKEADLLRVALANREREEVQHTKSVARQQKQLVRLHGQVAALEIQLSLDQEKEIPFTEEELAVLRTPNVPALLVSIRPAPTSAGVGVTAVPKLYRYQITKPVLLRNIGIIPSAGNILLPPELRALDAEARALLETHQFDEAAARYESLLNRAPHYAAALTNLAIIRLQQNRLESALALLQKSARLSPKDSQTHALLGFLYIQQKQYDEAVSELARAVTLDRQNATAYYHLGMVYTQRGQLQRAEQQFRRVIQLKPNFGDAHYNLAVVYMKRSPPQLGLARLHYHKAMETGIAKNPKLEEFLGKETATVLRADVPNKQTKSPRLQN